MDDRVCQGCPHTRTRSPRPRVLRGGCKRVGGSAMTPAELTDDEARVLMAVRDEGAFLKAITFGDMRVIEYDGFLRLVKSGTFYKYELTRAGARALAAHEEKQR